VPELKKDVASEESKGLRQSEEMRTGSKHYGTIPQIPLLASLALHPGLTPRSSRCREQQDRGYPWGDTVNISQPEAAVCQDRM